MKELYKTVTFLMLGIYIGFIVSEQYIIDNVESVIEEVTKDEWISAKGNLLLAFAIRNNEIDKALEFTENRMIMNVNAFTGKGKKLNELSEYEVATLVQIKEYWVNDCKKNCLHDIKQILSDERYK